MNKELQAQLDLLFKEQSDNIIALNFNDRESLIQSLKKIKRLNEEIISLKKLAEETE